MAGPTATGAVRALVVEACRIADRLDRLHQLLSDGSDEAWNEGQA